MPSPNKVALKAYLTSEEYENVKAKAGQARVSISEFVKKVCLGYEPKSKTDHEAVLAMLAVNRDLSRLGNLLKLAIAKEALDENQITDLIQSITETKAVLMKKVEAV